MPAYAVTDFTTAAIPEDERLWVPKAENVWFRPLLFNTVNRLAATRSVRRGALGSWPTLPASGRHVAALLSKPSSRGETGLEL
jgi:hypothetical protein